jgi:hypothetical protein
MSNTTQQSGTYEALVSDVGGFAAPRNHLLRQKAAAYAPQVHQITRTRSRAVGEIEHTLDHLLDCACIPEGLALCKALCRYYYPINPAATASYVHAYREMWDSEAPQQQEVAS